MNYEHHENDNYSTDFAAFSVSILKMTQLFSCMNNGNYYRVFFTQNKIDDQILKLTEAEEQ